MGGQRLALAVALVGSGLVACKAKPAAPVAPAPAPASAPVAPTTATPVAAVPAAGSAAPQPAATPGITPVASAPAVKVTLDEVGLEATSMDRSVDPCVDFYQFACGGWLQANPIPADRARWGRGSEMDERVKAALKGLLDDDAKGIGMDAGGKKVGDYYASCMDEAAIEKAGTASIKPLLDKAQKVKDARSWVAAVTELHRAGIWVVWGASASADPKDSTTNVTQLDASGLGLPDRDYYLLPEFKDVLAAYKAHVARLLVLAGTPQAKAEAAAAEVIAIETELAKLTKTRVERRDPQAAYNPTDLKALGKQTKQLDWKAYFKALGVTPSSKIVVGTPKYFAALDGLRGRLKPAQWASYFTYHLVAQLAPALPKAFDAEAFELDKIVSGVEQQRDRFKRCIDATTEGLGELVGHQYVDKYFPATSRQLAVTLVDAIAKAMSDQLGTLDWMSDPTRAVAQSKLAKLVRMIGYPDRWRVYDFDVKRDDYAGNVVRARAFETHRVLARSGKPVDRSEWLMNTFDINAYYEPTANNMALLAGMLQPPFFGPDRSIAANLGGIGMVVGHELTHGFDDQGSQYDGDGNLKNWWPKDDKDKFDGRAACVADQYGGFEAMPKGFVNGKLTLGENIADLGGVKMAFKAYRALRKDATKTYVADGFTEDQQFFIAVGQKGCSKDRPAEIQRRLATDPHAPPKFRVYGPLRNLPEFSAAFSCAPGTPMHPAKACSVW